MSDVPNMPLAGYRAAPTSKTPATEADYLAMLPPLDMAELQLDLGYLLGSLRYSQLGRYAPDRFQDTRVGPLLKSFQKRLEDTDRTSTEGGVPCAPPPTGRTGWARSPPPLPPAVPPSIVTVAVVLGRLNCNCVPPSVIGLVSLAGSNTIVSVPL